MPILFQVSSQVLDVAHLSCRDEFFVSPLVYIFKVSDSFHFERISFHLFFLTLRASAWGGTWDLCQLYSRCLRWTYFAESNRKCLVPTSSQALFYIVVPYLLLTRHQMSLVLVVTRTMSSEI